MRRTALRLTAAVALGALLWTLPTAKAAAQQTLEAHAKSGKTTMIGAFWGRDGQNETARGVGAARLSSMERSSLRSFV
jgi:hypothetical protein